MSHTATNARPLTLDGKVLCANCNSQMRNTSRRYYCPNTTVESGGSCLTRPLDAKELLHSVFTRMIKRLATEEIVEDAVRNIKRSTQENAQTQHHIIEQAETAIAEATARNGGVPQPGIQDGRITALDVDTAGLTFQIMIAQEELDKLEFIGDEAGLRETISDPDTYMRTSSQDYAQELLELLIKDVRVDNGHATILYKHPMPAIERPGAILAETFTL